MKSWVQQSAHNKQVQIAATCNVGWKLIEPSTGDVVLSNNSQFARTGPSSDFGIDVLQAAASQSADVELPVSEDDREQVVRLALDDAVRKSLAKIDRFLQSRGGLESGAVNLAPSTKPATRGAPTPPTPAPVGAARSQQAAPAALPKSTPGKVCPACGALNDPAAKFCKRCGGNL
jgi:ribosomal protein L40E